MANGLDSSITHRTVQTIGKQKHETKYYSDGRDSRTDVFDSKTDEYIGKVMPGGSIVNLLSR